MKMKSAVKLLFPPVLIEAGKRAVNWQCYYKGDYDSWQAALAESKGYENNDILNKVKDAALKVKAGEALYEKDSVLFYEKDTFPIITWLLLISTIEKGKLKILDFGGSLGSSYFRFRHLFDRIDDMEYSIVEQSHFVDCGNELFQEEKHLKFYQTIQDCLKARNNDVNVLLLSGSIQYFDEPYQYLDSFLESNIPYIVIDSTCFHNEPDRIVVQVVPKHIYRSSYPAWIFNREKLVNYMKSKYELIFEWDSIEGGKGMPYKDKNYSQLPYKGMMFQLINK